MKPLGDAFIKLVRMIIAPVVFRTVVVGIAGVGDVKAVGKAGILTLLYFEVVSTVALLMGLVVVNLGVCTPLAEFAAAHQAHPEALAVAIGSLNGPKYPDDGVDEVLKKYFAGMRLKDARTNLLVTAYAIELRCPFFFRSWQAQAQATHLTHDFESWQVARCTSAAPTYFPIYMSGDGAFVDGSLWARNPMALAVVEAMGVLDWPREDIRVLSLGCTSSHLDGAWSKRVSLGTSYWGAHIAEVFMKAQSSSAIATAHTLIGSHNVFRISPDTTAQGFTLDGVKRMPELEALGRNEAARALADLAATFFTAPAAPFTPDHQLDAEKTPPLDAASALGIVAA